MPELTPLDMVQRLAEGPPAPVYLIYGEEAFLRQSAIRHLREAVDGAAPGSSLHVHRFDGRETPFDQILEQARMPGFLGSRRLVIVSDLPALTGGPGEAVLLEYIRDPAPEACVAIVHEENVDGRRKVVRALRRHAVVVPCETPQGRELVRWLTDRFAAAGVQVSNAAIQRLASAHPDSLQLLDAEVAKIAAYVGDGGRVETSDVDAVRTGPGETSIFDLVDALGERRPAVALRLTSRMLEDGEPPPRLLYMVTRQIRLIWQARSLLQRGLGQGPIRRELGQHPFVVRKVLAQSRRYRESELARAYELLLAADLAIKQGGQPPETVLQATVVRLAKGEEPATGSTRRQQHRSLRSSRPQGAS